MVAGLQAENDRLRGELTRYKCIVHEAYKHGYEYGHNSTVEGNGYYPEESADEYIKELQESNDAVYMAEGPQHD